MKRMLSTIWLISVSATMLIGQGRVNFNNYDFGLQPIYVGDRYGFPTSSQPVYAGSDCSIELLWAPAGTYPSEASFLAAVIGRSPSVPFFGTTGSEPAHGPTLDGTGLFDAGPVPIGPPGNYTMQARGWYNGGRYSTYESSRNAGLSAGSSVLFTMSVTAPPVGAVSTVFPSFIIGVPEPSAFVLTGLGIACLLFCRRRK